MVVDGTENEVRAARRELNGLLGGGLTSAGPVCRHEGVAVSGLADGAAGEGGHTGPVVVSVHPERAPPPGLAPMPDDTVPVFVVVGSRRRPGRSRRVASRTYPPSPRTRETS